MPRIQKENPTAVARINQTLKFSYNDLLLVPKWFQLQKRRCPRILKWRHCITGREKVDITKPQANITKTVSTRLKMNVLKILSFGLLI